jgi:hypothetical protein
MEDEGYVEGNALGTFIHSQKNVLISLTLYELSPPFC